MRPSTTPSAYCRLTVLAPRARVDVSLPTDVPLAELVPMVLELVGEPAPRTGGRPRRPEPWRLTGPAGGPLPPAATLAELGVLDGELLRLGPVVTPPPAPVFGDPVDVLASTAESGTDPAGGRVARAAVLAAALAAAALVAGVHAHPPGGGAPPPAVVAAVLVGALGAAAGVVGAVLLLRGAGAADGQPTAAAACAALAAVPLAAAAGWAAAGGPPGATHVLLAAAGAGTAAALGQTVLRRVAPLLVGIVVVAALVATGALVQLRTGVGAAVVATGLGALALVAGPLLPRAAIALAGLPRPLVPTDAQQLVAADTGSDVLPVAELTERAALARGQLAGLVGGTAAVAAAAAPLAATVPGWTGPALAAVIVTVLLMRARGFADAAPTRTLQAAGLVAGLALAALLATAAAPAVRLAVAAALLGVAVLTISATARGEPLASPVSRRAVDLLEGVLVAAAVPLALGAMGVYTFVRHL